ncbi:molybdopterin converting factor subunit 1 [Catenovulum sediminis]|uniref:Molybdopterin synthase sulfur carrier subunit n=1 Tax=Catenovulum sediminis TaxID=1740262 RepID=A0ABV1RLI4_9ALTE|nr:molybdopterin converting factor subunit 1 [Catenovulum sediminis]
MVKILFFAKLKEELDCASMQLDINDNLTVEQLKQRLVQQQPNWQSALLRAKTLCAINQTMASANSIVSDGDEVAFFPPVTGG